MIRRCLFIATTLILTSCASEPETGSLMYLPPPDGMPAEFTAPAPMSHYQTPQKTEEEELHQFSIAELQSHLGLARAPQSLGFDQKKFDGCRMGLKENGQKCGPRYLSVVHFRLVCRDSVETIQYVPTNLTPLVRTMEWRLGGARGNTSTDSEGFGQVRMVSERPTKGQRFMLIIGKRSVGVEAGEVNRIVLPGDWCWGYASTHPISIPDLSNILLPTILTEN